MVFFSPENGIYRHDGNGRTDLLAKATELFFQKIAGANHGHP